MDGTRRSDIRPGLRVSIVLKKNQKTGKLSEGIVKHILTRNVHIQPFLKLLIEGAETTISGREFHMRVTLSVKKYFLRLYFTDWVAL